MEEGEEELAMVMRRHFPLTFRSKREAASLLAAVRREQPDARFVRWRRRAGGWAACLSTARPLSGESRGLAVREDLTGGHCACSR